MNGDPREQNPGAADDFTVTQPLTPEQTASLLTSYSSILTPEEVDLQLIAVYGLDRMPGCESRHRSQMGERWCEQCEKKLEPKQARFCSRRCSFASFSGEGG